MMGRGGGVGSCGISRDRWGGGSGRGDELLCVVVRLRGGCFVGG